MSKELESMIFLEDTLSCFINNSNKEYCQVTFTRPQAREYLRDYKTVYEVLGQFKELLSRDFLFRVFPYDVAKAFREYLESNDVIKEWLE